MSNYVPFSAAGRACPPWPIPNVWLGVTVCNQAEADAKIPLLLRTPAALRFVSVEPMLGALDLARWLSHCTTTATTGALLDWVICGAETRPPCA